MRHRDALLKESDRLRKLENAKNKDITILRALALCIIVAAGDKTIANEATKILLPELKLKESKRVAFLILFLRGHRKQKGRPRKSEMQEAQDCITGAKKEWRKTNDQTNRP